MAKSPGWRRALDYAFLALAAGVVFYVYVLVPTPIALRWWQPELSAHMRARLAEARDAGEDLEIRHSWVGLDGIARNLQRAVVAAEDGNFWQHDGVDWAAIGEELRYQGDDEFSWSDPGDRRALADAVGYLRRNSAAVKGRSTITQQLAKNLYFSTDRSFLRKIGELIATRRIERFVSKDRILELYLNYAEFGPGLFGAEAAAREYFGASAADLTIYQAATLAATLPHPRTSNPAHRPGRMAWRRDRLLGLLQAGAGARDAPPGPALPPPLPEVEDPDPGRDLAGEAVDSAEADLEPADSAGGAGDATDQGQDPADAASDSMGNPPPDV
ncbi:MAG TPA: transglycosylase domain-containing protein [Longimicrobiales bacterium]|nr:transglycosylase domain-containing protein [Longimicrobiales bacterium]